MEDATAPKHSTELIYFDDYAAEWDHPRWKIRRMSIDLSHSDNIETKIIQG